MRGQFGQGERAAGAQHHAGHHFLFAQVAGHAEHGAFEHAGVGFYAHLHLGAGNVLAAPAHHVLAPAHKVEVAVRILAQHVAGVEPQVLERLQRGPGHAVVALREQRGLRGAHQQLAGLAHGHRKALRVHQAHAERGGGLAARAHAPRRVQRCEHHATRLGGAIQLHQAAAKALFELRRKCGQRYAPAQAGAVVAVARRGGLLPEHGDGGAHEVEHRGLQRAHLVPVARDAEPLPQRRHAAQQQRGGNGHHRGIEVEHGIRAVQHVVAAQLQPIDEDLRLAQHKAVRNHRRLGAARGAGGVEQQAQRVERDLGPGQAGGGGLHAAQQRVGRIVRAAVGQQQAVTAQHEHAARGLQLALHLRPGCVQRGVHDDQPAFHQVDRAGQCCPAEHRVDGRGHRAQLGQRKPQQGQLDAVGQHQRDAVARAHALGMQPGRQAVAFLVDLAVGPLARRHADERAVGHLGRRAAQLVPQRSTE